MPGTGLGPEGSIKLLPFMRLRLPALGQCLTIKNLASVVITFLIQVT